ncbi:HNH endonuclease signature motif containing protein [Alienimonas sp. DA493]|uniref:HNH endonuclease signature motif containing protein n=1 Tax=Alienimonas sp. DA493 TaxID=3373605 RepID=UPI003754DFA1
MGSRVRDKTGYVRITTERGSVLEHRHVMEQELGRPLPEGAVIHHKNGDRADNRPSNLELFDRSHPKGQRVADKIEFALEILRKWEPDALADECREPPDE